RGLYSSLDPAAVRSQMAQIRSAGIDTVIVSWWGPGSASDHAIPLILDQAKAQRLHVTVMIEPGWPSITDFETWVHYLLDHYGEHAAFYRNAKFDLPMVYVFDA